MNLVQLLLKLLSGNVLSQLAESLGLERQKAETGIKAVIPSLLAALTGLTSASGGADKLARAVDDADDSLLDELGKVFGGGASFADKGAGILGSLLGSGTVGDLAGAIGRVAGLSGGASKSMLGMLVPVVLGMLKKHKQENQLDAGGLAELLKGQRANISSAMPKELGTALANLQGLTGVSDWVNDAAASAGKVASASHVATPTTPPANGSKWFWPLLAALLLLGLLWYFWPKNEAVEVEPQVPGVTGVELTAPAVTRDITDLFAQATADFNGITDAASAEAALPRLRELPGRFEQVASDVALIPEAERGPLMTLWNESIATLKRLIDTVSALPGVRTVLEPVVEQLMQTLNQG